MTFPEENRQMIVGGACGRRGRVPRRTGRHPRRSERRHARDPEDMDSVDTMGEE